MSNVRTVSDTKRAFYSAFHRPIVSVYRRVIEELMVEMHLLSVSDDFVYDPLYALGIVTTYDTFMAGYRPEEHVPAIFAALCQAIASPDASAERYRQDAQAILTAAEGLSLDDFKQILSHLDTAPSDGLSAVLKAVAQRDRFKYSRAFGIGLYTVLGKIAPDLVADKDQLMDFMREIATALSISFEKLQKDIELYRSNLDKMEQAKLLMAEMVETERKKREERAKAQAEKAVVSATAEDGVGTVSETPEKPPENANP